MISYSDNNYSNAALRLIGNQKSNEVLDRLGIHKSRIYGEMSGAIELAGKQPEKVWYCQALCGLHPRYRADTLQYLCQPGEGHLYGDLEQGSQRQYLQQRIPAGVSRVNPDYEVAHKTGTNSHLGIYNDAGIIYCKRPFILVAFTQSTSSKAGQSFIRSLAEQLTRYFDSKA